MNEMVSFQLINAYCKPLLTFACECDKFNRSDLSQPNRVQNSVFWKVFKTYDKDCIADNQFSIRQLPISMDIDKRKMKYIGKLKLQKNKNLAGMFNISGYFQLNNCCQTITCQTFVIILNNVCWISFVEMLYMVSYFYLFCIFNLTVCC